jgi:multiple sugar transport system substrate-binding protein
MPVNDGKPQTALFVEDSLMVFKSAKNPQAVGKFLDYFYSDKSYQDFVTKEGFLPVTKSVGDAMSAQDPMTAEFIRELSAAQTYPVTDTRYPEVKVEAIKALQKVILGENTVESALNDLQKMAEALK